MPNDCKINIHKISEALLDDNGELFVCIAQTPPIDKEKILAGYTSEDVKNFLRSLLKADPSTGLNSRLDEMVADENKCVLILIPEFTISIKYWKELDTIIRSLQRPVIVIGGLGVVSSDNLRSWKNNQICGRKETQRSFGFADDVILGASTIRYNAGSCWIHHPTKGTECIIFLKNYLERASEAIEIEGLREGSHLLCIEARDLNIYPLICAEFTSQQIANRPLDRLKSHIEQTIIKRGRRKKILITGVAFEHFPSHSLWRNGIRTSVQIVGDQSIVTVIANAALNPCTVDEEKDKWRCLSGVFTARFDDSDQKSLSPARSLCGDPELIGIVCRTGCAQAICGVISWDLRSAARKYLWRTTHRAIAGLGGQLLIPDTGDVHADELKRFIRRYSPSVDCDATGCIEKTCQFRSGGSFTDNLRTKCRITCVTNKWRSMNAVMLHLESCNEPNAKRVIQTVFHGLEVETNYNKIDPDKIISFRSSLERGLIALGALKLCSSALWQAEDEGIGQIIDSKHGIQFLVWVDPGRRCKDIERSILKWTEDPAAGKPLLAVVCGSSGSCQEGLVDPREEEKRYLRRDDIGSPPLPRDRRDVQAPRLKRAYIVELGKIENFFDDTNFVQAIESYLGQGRLKIEQSQRG